MTGSELAAAAHSVAHGSAHAAKHSAVHISAPEETWLHFLYLLFGVPDWLAVSFLVGLALVILFWRMSKQLSFYPRGFQSL
jgi:hypothetical protein